MIFPPYLLVPKKFSLQCHISYLHVSNDQKNVQTVFNKRAVYLINTYGYTYTCTPYYVPTYIYQMFPGILQLKHFQHIYQRRYIRW